VLLFLETLGVLVGILLAFELQEWASNRAERAKHNQLMDRLFEETEMYVAVLRDLRDRLNEIVAREQSFAVKLGSGQCPAENEWGAAQTFNILPALTAPTSVYQELMGAGGLSSVERKDVREALAQFHGDLDWSQQQVTYFREFRYDPIPPRDPRVTVRFDPTKEEPEVSTFDRQALCADRVFKNTVAAAVRAQTVFASYHQGAVEDAAWDGSARRPLAAHLRAATSAGPRRSGQRCGRISHRPSRSLRAPSLQAWPSARGAGRARG
jgi:hypothetical protein